MSIRIMSMVWDNGPPDKAEVLILLALADFCNDAGECWPAVSSIAKKARMTERGAQKIIARLVDVGWIEIQPGGGRRNCNLYRLKNPEPCSPRTTFTPNTMTETPNTVPKNPEPCSPEPSLNHQEPSETPFLIPPDKPKPKKQRRKPEVELPEGWVPNDKNITDAQKKGFNMTEIDHEADSFRNFHHSKQSLYRDWDAAWRTWLNNAIKFGRRGSMASGQAPDGYGQSGSIASVVARRRAEGKV